MKKIIFSLLLFVGVLSIHAQCSEDTVNHCSKAFAVNSHYVKSFIGINLDSLKRMPEGAYHIDVKEAPADSFFVFNGIQYKTYVNIVSNQYQPELISLNYIKSIYAKDISADKCLFMINDVLITKDLNSFKIDKDYIHSVVVFPNRELQRIDGGTLNVYLILIYTKTDDFMYKDGHGYITYFLAPKETFTSFYSIFSC